jgi:hypothetical protein
MEIDAQAYGAIVDARQVAVAEETLADGVHQFFVGNGQKLPLADGLDTGNLFRGDVDVFVDLKSNLRLAAGPYEPQGTQDDSNDSHKGCNDSMLDVHLFSIVSFFNMSRSRRKAMVTLRSS